MSRRDETPTTAAVVLAAGVSKRFGSNKLLFPIRGRPVLEWSLEALKGFEFSLKLVVVNPISGLDYLLKDDIIKIVNYKHYEGLGSSVAVATNHLRNKVDAIFFMLGDQPLLKYEDIRRILSRFLENPSMIVAASVAGHLRNPMIFPSKYFEELSELSGDKGAREVAMEHRDFVAMVEIDPEHLLDVDSLEDTKKIEQFLE